MNKEEIQKAVDATGLTPVNIEKKLLIGKGVLKKVLDGKKELTEDQFNALLSLKKPESATEPEQKQNEDDEGAGPSDEKKDDPENVSIASLLFEICEKHGVDPREALHALDTYLGLKYMIADIAAEDASQDEEPETDHVLKQYPKPAVDLTRFIDVDE